MKLRRFKTRQALSDELLLSRHGLSVLKDNLFIGLDKLDGSRFFLSILPGVPLRGDVCAVAWATRT